MQRCRDLLIQGLHELNLNLNSIQIEQLLAFVQLIVKWNKTYNLTAIRQPEDMIALHLLDSLAIVPYIQGERMIDIGTGAGLPGIPVAIALPAVKVTLLDSNSKKTRFVQQAVLELTLKNVNIQHSRVEDYQIEQGFSTLTTRAFARLNDIIYCSQHLIAENGIILAMKAQLNDDELADITLHNTVIALHVPFINATRCVIRLSKL